MSKNMRIVVENIKSPASVIIDSEDMGLIIQELYARSGDDITAAIEMTDNSVRVAIDHPVKLRDYVAGKTKEELADIAEEVAGLSGITREDLEAATENLMSIIEDLTEPGDNCYTYIEIDN